MPVTSLLRITRHPDEEPYHVNLVVHASNGRQSSELEIYAAAADLSSAAQALSGFPKHSGDVFTWELGSELPEDRFAFYFRLRVWQVKASGRCAVEVRFNNNQDPPDRQVSEFSFGAYPSDLDRLGCLFREFSKLEQLVLEWAVEDDGVR
jgi:hypothetical protein